MNHKILKVGALLMFILSFICELGGPKPDMAVVSALTSGGFVLLMISFAVQFPTIDAPKEDKG